MTTLLVVLRNGHKFQVPVTDVDQFYGDIRKGASRTAVHDHYVDGPLWIQLGEIAAMHPADWATQSKPDA